jgi:Mg2+ and Co2+ transporter CorA
MYPMISKYSHKSLIWIDLESPKEEEILYLLEQYSIPSSLEEEIRKKSSKQKVKISSDYIFLYLNFPKILHIENKVEENKIIFILHEDFIITIHDEQVDALGEFLNNLEMDTTIPEDLKITNNGLLFFYLIKSLYINLKEQLVVNNTEIKELENKIIGIKKKNISKSIYNKNYILIKIDQSLNSHGRILEYLKDPLTLVYGEKFEYYISLINNEFREAKDMVSEQGKNFVNLYNISNLVLIDQNSKKLKILTRLSILSLIIVILTFLYVFSNI